MEFEIAYLVAAVYHFNHYTTETPRMTMSKENYKYYSFL